MKKFSAVVLMFFLTLAVFAGRATSRSPGDAEAQTPTVPQAAYDPVGELARPESVSDYFRGVVVDGDYAYALGREGTLLTYDISSLSGDGFTTLDAPANTTALESGYGLLQQGDTLYVYGLNGVQPVDVSNPAAPVAGTATNDAWIVNAQLQDGYLVGAADDAVVVYSLEAAGPTLVESAALTDGERAFSLSIFDSVMMVRHTGAGGANNGYSIIEFSSLESLGTPTRIDDAALAYQQHVFGDRMVACTDYVLELWDVSTPTSPTLLTSTSLPEFGDGRICIRDGDRIITNGTVYGVDGENIIQVDAFEPTYGQSDGYPHTGGFNEDFIFVTQNVRVLVIERPGEENFQCFVAEADTYAWDNFGSNRDNNYGDAATVDVASLGDVNLDRRYTYLRFNLDAIPTRATILSADLELYLVDVVGSGSELDIALRGVEEAWAELTLTWNNQPTRSATEYDVQTVTDNTGWKSWNAADLVDEWISGQRSNRGVALTTGGVGSAPAQFHSREGSSTLAPQLCVEWEEPEFATLLIGAPGESVTDGDNELEQAGAVNALYSRGSTLSSTGDEIWHQGSPGVAGALEANDNFGRTLATGDFNGDGYRDAAIGTPLEDVEDGDAVANAGAVNVLYGAVSGLSSAGSQIWHQNSPGIASEAAEAQDYFGSALAAGDFNGDGYDDLAIGVPKETVDGQDDAGAVNILYGTADGLTAANEEVWHQGETFIIDDPEAGDQFGFSLSAGDFDEDGYADLAIGVPYEDIEVTIDGEVESITNAGAVSVLPGSSGGITYVGDVLLHQDSEFVAGRAEDNDLFGWSLAAADITGDGFDDLAVGVRQESIENAGALQAGAVNLLIGSRSGLVGGSIWHQDSPGVAGRAESNDYFGHALAAGDFNNDGYADLAVGAYWEGTGSLSDNGAVNVLYGSSACTLSSEGDQIWDQDTDGVPGEAENGDHFGQSLAAGDLNGDGYDDLAVGIPGESVGDLSGAGAANVFYGTSSGLTSDGSQIWHQDSAGVNGVAESGDGFGSALAILNSPPADSPPSELPSDILDLDAVSWRSGRNYTSNGFGDRFDELEAQGYMIVDIETDVFDGDQRVGDVWQRNVDGRAWRERRDMSLSNFEARQEQLEQDGYRMIDQEVYVLGSSTNYAGIWIENTEGLAWDNYYDVTSSEFGNLFDTYEAMGYMPIDIDAYVVDGELLYSAIWVDNVDNLRWHEFRNMSSGGFANRLNQYRSDFRMSDFESYRYNGEQFYAGIWVENVNGREWYERHDMSNQDFSETWSALRDAGYRLIDYEVYPTGNGWRYAGIWRQNGSRPDWPVRCAVDAVLEEQVGTHDIPGMSVAIAQDGEWRYLRGLGYADVNNSVNADSRTIYRLASVSKAVAGVLTMRLEEGGVMTRTQPASVYVPELPPTHTYTIEQTVNNRSGIGHYDHYSSVVDSYATALDATQAILDNRTWLQFTPGMGYEYSTHAYTFAGAAMEGAAGAPIGSIVDQYLRTPFNLDTLRPENPVTPDPKRSLLYNSNTNNETRRDDLSWKVLGGGLEASAYDLARFGMQILDGTIISASSRQQMWTEPDYYGCGVDAYALGWCVGTDGGSRVAWKTGHQRGANSYIRVYPDENIVIVLLSNRKWGGHETATMGAAIGSYILDEITATASAVAGLRVSTPTEHEVDEPDSEGLPAEYVVWPVSNPVDTGNDDIGEPVPYSEPPVGVLHLPMIVR